MHLGTIARTRKTRSKASLYLRGASECVSILDPVAEPVALRDLAWVGFRVEEGAQPASNLRRIFLCKIFYKGMKEIFSFESYLLLFRRC